MWLLKSGTDPALPSMLPAIPVVLPSVIPCPAAEW